MLIEPQFLSSFPILMIANLEINAGEAQFTSFVMNTNLTSSISIMFPFT